MSLEEMVEKIWQMVTELCYLGIEPITFEDDTTHNLLWTTQDLWFGWLYDQINGRCSMAAMASFNLENEVISKYNEILTLYSKLNDKN